MALPASSGTIQSPVLGVIATIVGSARAPLSDGEGAEPVGPGERVGLAHTAAADERGGVTGVRALGPPPPALLDEVMEAVIDEELGLGANRVGCPHRRQLIERHVGGD